MNWLAEMKKAQDANKSLLAKAKADDSRAFTEEEQADFDANIKRIEDCKRMRDAEASTASLDAELTTPVNTVPAAVGTPAPVAKKAERIYNTLAEQLADIKKATLTGRPSAKLQKLQEVQANALGGNEGVGSDGGYLVQSDFAGAILESAVKDDGILARVDTFEISGNSNRLEWVQVDEDDVSTTVFGGLKVYWVAEAATVEASKPKIKKRDIELEKLMGLAYVTYELDQDSSFVEELLRKGFTTAIRRELTGQVINGDGQGKPIGILQGGGLVEVAKESGQTANTIVYENIVKMYHRAIDPRSGGYAWIVHPDAHEQLDTMKFEVGTGGVPVYQPASLTGTIDTLRGLPVLTSDCCSALGTKGDIILADLSDYFLPTKKGVQEDVSIHVQFLSAQDAYRWIFRVNGQPKTENQLTIKNSSKKRGRYIVVGSRS